MMKRKMKRDLKKKVIHYISDFGEFTSLHGFRYILSNKLRLHPIERIFWLLMVSLAAYGAFSLILNNYNRYSANPTVISLEKNYRDWDIAFPAATVCFVDRLNHTLAEEYIIERWTVDSNTSEFNVYKKFLYSLVNLTYENMNEFEEFVDNEELRSIKGEEMVEISRRVMIKMEFHATIFNEAYKGLSFEESLTEFGICFTYSGALSSHLAPTTEKRGAGVDRPPILPKCNSLNSLCYARIEDLPRPIRYYIHSPTEIPDLADKYFTVFRNMERDTTFRFQETVASRELRRLEPKQRGCRFLDEPERDAGGAASAERGAQVSASSRTYYYTYNLCKMNCRKRLAVKYCGCAPYFYHKEDGVRVCKVRELACLAKYSQQIVRLVDPATGRSVPCDCLFQCESTDFYTDKENVRRWSYPVPCNIRFRWAIEHYGKTRQKRDIIFGLEDLLVSLGSTAALFLGCSVISFLEIVYFLTLRLFWYIVRSH